MENRFIKIACLTVLMTGSALQAMDQFNQAELNEMFRQAGYSQAELNKMLIEEAHKGQKQLVESLIASGADVNAAESRTGWTALMIAAGSAHKEICKLLIEYGANVNAMAKNGGTILWRVATYGRGEKSEICKLLIDAMVKLTDQERSEISTLLSLKKRNIPGLHPESKKIIAQTRLDDIKRLKKQNAREQIMKINIDSMKQELLDYLKTI